MKLLSTLTLRISAQERTFRVWDEYFILLSAF